MRKLISRSGFWLLAAVLLVGSLSLSRAFAIDGESSTLRFDAPEQFREDLDQYASKLQIGVFQVAVASKNPNYDSYDYVASDAFRARKRRRSSFWIMVKFRIKFVRLGIHYLLRMECI